MVKEEEEEEELPSVGSDGKRACGGNQSEVEARARVEKGRKETSEGVFFFGFEPAETRTSEQQGSWKKREEREEREEVKGGRKRGLWLAQPKAVSVDREGEKESIEGYNL